MPYTFEMHQLELCGELVSALVKVVACIKAGVAAAVQLDLARAADGAHVAAKLVTDHAHHALQLRQPLRLNRHSKLLLTPIQGHNLCARSGVDLLCSRQPMHLNKHKLLMKPARSPPPRQIWRVSS